MPKDPLSLVIRLDDGSKLKFDVPDRQSLPRVVNQAEIELHKHLHTDLVNSHIRTDQHMHTHV